MRRFSPRIRRARGDSPGRANLSQSVSIRGMPRILGTAALLLALLASAGCASLARSATHRFAEDLAATILKQDDPEIVREGAPAYLLAVDALVEGDPENPTLLLTGTKLYGAYSSAFVEDEARVKRLRTRALEYGRRALCATLLDVCAAISRPFDAFEASLATVRSSDLPTLYGFGAAWAGWVQAHADDWSAVAELPKIEALMQRVVELDGSYDHAGAHLYLGVLLTLRPASLGGRPEDGRDHFERAIALSAGAHLMAKVLFARHYARLVFDRELHDRLLAEVVAADPQAPELTLSNILARREAQRLLDAAADYF